MWYCWVVCGGVGGDQDGGWWVNLVMYGEMWLVDCCLFYFCDWGKQSLIGITLYTLDYFDFLYFFTCTKQLISWFFC